MYKQQTLIISLNFTKIINLFFKSDWLMTMLFLGQQRCWLRNMPHLVKSVSAVVTASPLVCIIFLIIQQPIVNHPYLIISLMVEMGIFTALALFLKSLH